MKITCPKCHQSIPPEGINVAKAIAYCTPCQEAFPLTGIVKDAPARVEQPESTLVVLTRTDKTLGLALAAGGFRGIGCFFLFFSLFWNGVTWTLIISFLAIGGPNTGPFTGSTVFGIGANVFQSLFFIPFVLIGLGTLAAAIYCIFADTALAMDKTSFLVERRIFGRRFSKTYALSDIKDIALAEAYKQNEQPVYGVGIHLISRRKALTFGSNLSDEEKQWLVGELYAFWQEQKG